MSQVTETVIKLIHADGEGTGRTEIRLVSWNDREPVLEKRQYVRDRVTGEERIGKNRGFTYADLKLLRLWLEPLIAYHEKGTPIEPKTTYNIKKSAR